MGAMTAGREYAQGAPPTATAPARAVPSARRGPSVRHCLSAAAWLAGALAAFACYLWLARTRAVDSDGAAQALQAWDMLHGNPLLRGWWLSDVSFYTTELPQYMLVELARGLNADVIPVAAAMTFTLVVLLAAVVAKGTARGRAAVARVLITVGIVMAPEPSAGVKIFISSPDHIGTTVPVLLVLLILDRARQRWFIPVLVSAVLAVAAVADTLVLFIAVVPLALVCAFRVCRAVLRGGKPLWSQWYDLSLGMGALAAAAAARVTLDALRAAGGFVVQPPLAQLSGVHQLLHGLSVASQSLLLLAGADFLSAGQSHPALAIEWLHLAGLIAVGLGALVAIRRFLREPGLVDQVLLIAIVVNLASYALSTQASSVLSTREIVAVLPLGAVLAGRQLGDRLLAIRWAPVAALLVLAGYIGGLGYALAQPPAQPQNQQLTSWLAAHHLRSGLSGYWQSNIVSLTSGDRVQVRQITEDGPHLVPYRWEADMAWYNPRHAVATFVVLAPGTQEYPGFTPERLVLTTFGQPAHTYRVGPYLVLVWDRNLLRKLDVGHGTVY
jgi:hypothetical protein